MIQKCLTPSAPGDLVMCHAFSTGLLSQIVCLFFWLS